MREVVGISSVRHRLGAMRHDARAVAPEWARARWTLGPGPNAALTFDDGPDPKFTPRVLDVLAGLHAPATFFVVGRRARQHPDLVRRMIAEGHAVGSHSDSHPDPGGLPPGKAARDYWRGRRAVETVIGRSTSLFRPPMGMVDLPQAIVIRALRLRPWLWSLDTLDWRVGATPQSILDRVGRPKPAEVILLHDANADGLGESDRSATVAALPGIVERIRDCGLLLTTLPSAHRLPAR